MLPMARSRSSLAISHSAWSGSVSGAVAPSYRSGAKAVKPRGREAVAHVLDVRARPQPLVQHPTQGPPSPAV